MTISEEARQARNAYMRKYRENMTEDQRKREREYQKEWRKNNPDRVKKYQETYWTRKAKESEVSI